MKTTDQFHDLRQCGNGSRAVETRDGEAYPLCRPDFILEKQTHAGSAFCRNNWSY
jgi:hypothetical protein